MIRFPLIGLAALTLTAAAPDPISPARLSADVKTLASDAFEGRAPGTPGETKTVDWLVAQFKAMGLQPGGPDGQWTQAVPLIRTQIGQGRMKAGAMPLVQGQGVYVSTVRPVDRVAIKDAPMVFVGYGVHAPERGWDGPRHGACRDQNTDRAVLDIFGCADWLRRQPSTLYDGAAGASEQQIERSDGPRGAFRDYHDRSRNR